MNSIVKTMQKIGSKTCSLSATEAVSYLEELWDTDPTTLVYGNLYNPLAENQDLSALIVVGNAEQLMPILAQLAAASGWKGESQ